MYLFSCLSQKWNDSDDYDVDDTARSPGSIFYLSLFQFPLFIAVLQP